MIPPQPRNVYDQQTLDILRALLDENQLLDSLMPLTAKEIIGPFKIQCMPTIQHPEIINMIKEKLIDIILQEKEECVDYLTLPKFKNLSEQTSKTLKEVLSQVWTQFQIKINEAKNEMKCEMFFCTSSNLKEAQSFHIGLFNFFKTSFFYGCIGNANSQQYYHPDYPISRQNPPPQHFPHFSSNEAQIPQFMHHDFSENKDLMGKYGMNSGNSREKDHLFSPPQQVKVEQNQISEVQRVKYEGEVKNSVQKPSKKSKKHDESVAPQTKFEEQDIYLKSDRNYSKCRCKGNFQKEGRYFECTECKKRYHLGCLKIPLDAVEKSKGQKLCPSCSLLKSNIFYEILGDPIESLWVEEKQFSKSKIIIKGKRSVEIMKNNYSIQLRFLRFVGKAIFQLEDLHGSGKGTKFNQIIIKPDMIAQGNSGDEIKISLEPLPMSNKAENPNKKNPLVYLTVYVVRLKSVEQILSCNFEYSEDNYLDQFFKNPDDENEKLKIEIIDGELKMITTPVRGLNCEHHNVFDLEEFIRHTLNLGSDSCFFCPRKCQSFKIDRKIQRELQKIRESVNDPQKYPSEIYYDKNGTFSWQELQVGNQSEDNSQQMSSVIESNLDFNSSGDDK